MKTMKLTGALSLLGLLSISGHSYALSCDTEVLEEKKQEFTELKALVSDGSNEALQNQLRASAQEVVRYSQACFTDLYSSSSASSASIDDGGVWFDQPSGFAPFGTKWGAGTSFPPASPPGIPGGTVTYSYMPSGVDQSAGGADPNSTLNSLPGFSACILAEVDFAFSAWSAIADINFVEVVDNGIAFNATGAVGDIRIGTHTFDGPSGILAHAFFPPPNGNTASGDMHFDKDENWTCDTSGFDIGIVAIHELGHAIGLNHETTVTAIMNPSYNPTLLGLQTDDVNGAQAIYGTITSGGDPDDTIAEAGRTGYGVTTLGTIASGEDISLYGFEAYVGQVFNIDMDADPSGPNLDAVLSVFDDTGTLLAQDDASVGPLPENFGLEAFISWTAPATGTYYVGVSSFANLNYDINTGGGDVAGSTTGNFSMIIKPDVDLTNAGVVGGDRAGFGVSIDGEWTAVGIRLADNIATNGGAVDMYRHNGDGTWSFHSRIADSQISDQGHFGHSVALSGEILMVGADNWTEGPGTGRMGNVHWYEYNSGTDTWDFLIPWCITITGCATNVGDNVGRSVDNDGVYNVFGAPNSDAVGFNSGEIHIAAINGSGGANFLEATLTAPDGDANDRFGNAVAIAGNYVVTGAQRDEPNGVNSGSAYVFERIAGTWTPVDKLIPSDGAAGDFFGTDVDITTGPGGDFIVVGARTTDDPGANNVGKVYIFTRNPDGTWGETQIVQADDRIAGDFYGSTVAIDGLRMVVGTYRRDQFGDDSGKAYSYLWDPSNGFEEVAQLYNDETTTRDEFSGRGNAIAIDGHNAVMGSWLDNRPSNNTGAAYGFGL